MKIDEDKVEVVGGILVGVGLILVFFGIGAPLVAGAILSGSVVIAKSINRGLTETNLDDKQKDDEF